VQVRSSGRNETIDADYVISSIPLKYLAAYLLHDNSNMVRDIGNALKYRDIRVIYIILDKEYYSNVHWFYLLDPHFKFNRMSEQKNLNQESSPPGRTVISLDISCQRGDHLWNMPDEQLFQLALDDLRHMGIEKSHILDYFSLKLEDVYPIYSLGFGKDFNNCIQALKRFRNVFSTGRQGLFLNNDIHDSMEMGILAGTFIRSGRESCEWYAYISKYIRERLQGNIA
jgi:protoporphyrinogen oxidase